MTKKTYMKPVMNVVRIQQRHIICASLDGNGMNTKLPSGREGRSAGSLLFSLTP